MCGTYLTEKAEILPIGIHVNILFLIQTDKKVMRKNCFKIMFICLPWLEKHKTNFY